MTSLLQVWGMVTSALVLTCCSLVMNLQTCHAELAASLQSKTAANLLQVKIVIWAYVSCNYILNIYDIDMCSSMVYKCHIVLI